MQKNTLKFILDSLLFISVTSTAAIGFLLGFVIPKGRTAAPAEKFFLGLHRHEWGDLHLILGISMLVILVLHLCLNWPWIKGTTQKHFGLRWSRFLLGLCSAWFFVLIIGWIAMR